MFIVDDNQIHKHIQPISLKGQQKEQSFTTKKFRQIVQIDRYFPFYDKGDENFVPPNNLHTIFITCCLCSNCPSVVCTKFAKTRIYPLGFLRI